MLIALLLCLVGWIVGEAKALRNLRVPCVLVMLAVVCIISYGLGSFLGASNANIDVTGATHTLLSTAVEQLDAGNTDRVRSELQLITERTNETYEGITFVAEIRAATERLTSP